MKIHYFYKKVYSQGFYDLEIIAWLEEQKISKQGVKVLDFSQLEKLRIFISKGEKYHNHTFNHEFSRDSCHGHWAETRNELMKAMNQSDFKPIDRNNYERFRKVAIAIYNKQSLVDFSYFKGPQTYTIRQII